MRMSVSRLEPENNVKENLLMTGELYVEFLLKRMRDLSNNIATPSNYASPMYRPK